MIFTALNTRTISQTLGAGREKDLEGGSLILFRPGVRPIDGEGNLS